MVLLRDRERKVEKESEAEIQRERERTFRIMGMSLDGWRVCGPRDGDRGSEMPMLKEIMHILRNAFKSSKFIKE